MTTGSCCRYAPIPDSTISGVPTLRIAQDDVADELLGRDPLALVIGMLLDQHMGWLELHGFGAAEQAALRARLRA
ncbi:hypothetical protein SAMN04488085_106217 [Geodermatophilus ruber]|uniref:Uncharacterized protein n=1 Tax=Geodermatophilus ruber TaxID=504800 RepID=A0A1I4F0D0_9ACTN|nr:hypothetical protein SAMN04488085_106217 [Geodermatophilus ruber]